MLTTGTSINKIIAILGISLLLFSCKQEETGISASQTESLNWPDKDLPVGDYQAWIKNPENGFCKSRTIESKIFTMTYLPSEFKAIQQLRKESENLALREEVAQEYSHLEFYELEIALPEFKDEAIKYVTSDPTDYQKLVQYYGFMANRDLKIVVGGDTILCPVHTWERTYNAANKIVLEFGFPADQLKDKTKETRDIIFYDRVFGCGPIHFRF